MEKLYISKKYSSDIGDIYAISSDVGVRKILISPENIPILSCADPFDSISQIEEYFKGNLKTFSVSLDLKVSKFTKSVLDVTYEIPYGSTTTYGEIAKQLDKKGASRAVGGALNRNPIPIIIPCHRVLAKNSLGGFALGTDTKTFLLALEGAV